MSVIEANNNMSTQRRQTYLKYARLLFYVRMTEFIMNLHDNVVFGFGQR